MLAPIHVSRNFFNSQIFLILFSKHVKIGFYGTFACDDFTNCDRTPPYLDTNFQNFQRLDFFGEESLW